MDMMRIFNDMKKLLPDLKQQVVSLEFLPVKIPALTGRECYNDIEILEPLESTDLPLNTIESYHIEEEPQVE